LSRVESGKHELIEEDLDPAGIVKACLDMMSARAKEAGINMLVSVPRDAITLRADARATKQVLLNLLSNGIKFTSAGGSIMTSLGRGPAGLELTVTDTGIGISEDTLSKLFDPFQRGD